MYTDIGFNKGIHFVLKTLFYRIAISKNPKSIFYGTSESTCFRVAAAVGQKNIGKAVIQKVIIRISFCF